MLRRIIDISLTVRPLDHHTLEPTALRLPSDIEPSGPERSRKGIQRLCLLRPYQIGPHEQDIGMDILLGDSLPHSHAEAFWVNKATVLDEVPRHQRWAIRDIASVPAAEFTCEASVINLSEVELEGKEITAALLAAHGQHVRRGDFVLLRTDFDKRHPPGQPDPSRGSPAIAPKLTMGAAEWLVRDRHIIGIAADSSGGLFTQAPNEMSVHTYFYMNAVLMIDEMIDFDLLPDDRVFFAGGVSLRTAGIGSSPARPVAIPLESAAWGEDAIDLFREMEPTDGAVPAPPFPRIEPAELRAEIYKRFQITWLQISLDEALEERLSAGGPVRPQRDFGSPIRRFSSHLGTHMLLPTGKRPTRDLIAPATVFDLEAVGPRGVIGLDAVEAAAQRAGFTAGQAVVLKTGFTDLYYHRPDYLRWSPGIDPRAIAWLQREGARFLVTDLASLDVEAEGGWGEARRAVAETGLPVVLCASNLWRIEHASFRVICSPLPLTGLDASPCRVLCVEDWT